MSAALAAGTGPLMVAAGKAVHLLVFNAVAAALYGATIYLVAPHGLTTVCWAVAVCQAAALAAIYVLVHRTLGIRVRKLLADALPSFASSGPLVVVAFAARAELHADAFPRLRSSSPWRCWRSRLPRRPAAAVQVGLVQSRAPHPQAHLGGAPRRIAANPVPPTPSPCRAWAGSIQSGGFAPFRRAAGGSVGRAIRAPYHRLLRWSSAHRGIARTSRARRSGWRYPFSQFEEESRPRSTPPWRLLKPGMTVFDVGANSASTPFRPRGPSAPRARMRLRAGLCLTSAVLVDDLRLNGLEDRVEVVLAAVSDTGEVDFWEQGASTLASPSPSAAARGVVRSGRAETTRRVVRRSRSTTSAAGGGGAQDS